MKAPSIRVCESIVRVGHRFTADEARRIWQRRGGRARARHYPGFVVRWATNASRARWNRVREAKGLPPLPLLPGPLVDRPRAIEMRRRRELAKLRAAYDGRHVVGAELSRLACSAGLRIAYAERYGQDDRGEHER